ncbi:MAG: hypothetical protein ACOYUZ_06460 [Patescibacteria group bacterium]
MDNTAYGVQRIVLFPHGPVQPAHQDTFMTLLLKCGADIGRLWFLPGNSANKSELQRYIEYLKRSRLGFCEDLGNCIVALTKCNPPAMMLASARRQLENEFPALRTAVWAVWIDMQDPFIFSNLHRLGEIEDEISPAPIWRDFDERAYLLLVPDCKDYPFLTVQAARVARLNGLYSQKESTSKRHNVLQNSLQPRPSSPESFRQPSSWTNAGRPVPQESYRAPKRGRITEDSSYRFLSEPPSKPDSRKG